MAGEGRGVSPANPVLTIRGIRRGWSLNGIVCGPPGKQAVISAHASPALHPPQRNRALVDQGTRGWLCGIMYRAIPRQAEEEEDRGDTLIPTDFKCTLRYRPTPPPGPELVRKRGRGGCSKIRQESRGHPGRWWGAGATPCWGVWRAKPPEKPIFF